MRGAKSKRRQIVFIEPLDRVRVIDAQRTEEEVFQDVLAAIGQTLRVAKKVALERVHDELVKLLSRMLQRTAK